MTNDSFILEITEGPYGTHGAIDVIDIKIDGKLVLSNCRPYDGMQPFIDVKLLEMNLGIPSTLWASVTKEHEYAFIGYLIRDNVFAPSKNPDDGLPPYQAKIIKADLVNPANALQHLLTEYQDGMAGFLQSIEGKERLSPQDMGEAIAENFPKGVPPLPYQ